MKLPKYIEIYEVSYFSNSLLCDMIRTYPFAGSVTGCEYVHGTIMTVFSKGREADLIYRYIGRPPRGEHDLLDAYDSHLIQDHLLPPKEVLRFPDRRNGAFILIPVRTTEADLGVIERLEDFGDFENLKTAKFAFLVLETGEEPFRFMERLGSHGTVVPVRFSYRPQEHGQEFIQHWLFTGNRVEGGKDIDLLGREDEFFTKQQALSEGRALWDWIASQYSQA